METSSNRVYISIEGLRIGITRRLLPLLFGSLLFAFAASVWRISLIGFNYLVVVDAALAIILATLFIWRKVFTPATISILLIAVLYILFISGIWTLGLMSAAFIVAPLISMYLILLGYKRLAVASVVFNVAYLIGTAFLHLYGMVISPATPNQYLMSPISWVIMITAVGLVSAAFVAPFAMVPGALEQSEERFHLAFESANVGACITGLDGRLLKVNNEICSMLGFSPDELESLTVRDITYHDDLAPSTDFIEQSQQGGTHRISLEKRYVKKNGQIVWGNISSSLVTDSNGTPQYYITYIQDITARKEAEEGLRASETHYRSLVENSPDIIAEFDADGKFLFVNSAVSEVSNIRPGDFVGKRMADVGFSKEQAEMRENVIRKVFESQKPFETEFEFEGVSGRRTYDWRAYPFLDHEGKVKSVFSINRDVTERKKAEEDHRKSEEKFYKIFHSSPAPMIITTMEDERFIDVNESYLKQMGFKRDEVIGKTSLEMNLWPDLHQRNKVYESIRASGSLRSSEIILRTKSGRIRNSILSGETLEIDGQKCFLFSALDITERKTAEDALRASMDELHALGARLENIREEERKSVSREVHDELGQILTAIHMDIVSLRKFSVADAKGFESQLQLILELTSSAMKAVHNISAKLRPGILDDLGLIATIEWQTEDFQNRTGTRCEVDLPDHDLPIDAERSTAVFRILQETLTNIARHAKATMVKVRVLDLDSATVLSVKDDGIGITNAQINDPKSYGLIGIRERLRPFDGECNINSSANNGTEIVVRLPKQPSSPSLQ